MTDEEFEGFLTTAVDLLAARQDALTETHKLGSYARFSFDQEQGSLDFIDEAAVTRLRAIVVPIGSWSVRSATWEVGLVERHRIVALSAQMPGPRH